MAVPRSYLIGTEPGSGADCWLYDAAADTRPSVMPQVLRLLPPGQMPLSDQLEALDLRHASALLLPGMRGIDDVCAVAECCPLDLLLVIDSARALDQVRALAQVPGVQRLVFDAAALSADLGIDDEAALLAARSAVVLASRLAGLAAPVDDSTLPAERARRLGFGARICRTPDDLAATQAAFSTFDHRLSP
jgi:citrate lyase subunit beta / citryl-CoA lyase